ncbi:MAG TPA: DUF4870 domain-containing protein [Leucothrix mucor]|nr:DUF4870 domain-containing protein [Leucothrix mucor]
MNLSEKQWGALTHAAAILGIMLPMALVLGPMIMWMVRRNDSAFIDAQGKEAVNFQLTILVTSFILVLLGGITKIFFALSAVVLAVGMIFSAIAAINIYKGKDYRYPFAVRLIK